MGGRYRVARQGARHAAGTRVRALGGWLSTSARARAGALLWTRRRAQAVVEFALGVTVMGLLLVGGIDFARVFYYDVMVTTAAAEGVRAAVAGAPDTDPGAGAITVSSAAVKSAPSGTITAGNVSVAPAQSGRNAEGVVTTVTVTFTFRPVTPLLALYIEQTPGQGLPITRKATERIRRPCQLSTWTPANPAPCPP
jgi:Flp pilus assembly protein TadG